MHLMPCLGVLSQLHINDIQDVPCGLPAGLREKYSKLYPEQTSSETPAAPHLNNAGTEVVANGDPKDLVKRLCGKALEAQVPSVLARF